jgi:hypothetical protein
MLTTKSLLNGERNYHSGILFVERPVDPASTSKELLQKTDEQPLRKNLFSLEKCCVFGCNCRNDWASTLKKVRVRTSILLFR